MPSLDPSWSAPLLTALLVVDSGDEPIEDPPAAVSEEDVAAPVAAVTPWSAGAFVDVAYVWSHNRPDNHVYRGAYTSPRSNEIALNAVGAYARHDATREEPWWLEVGLHAGAAIDAVYSGEPEPGGAGSRFAGPEVFKHVALANAGVKFRSRTEVGAGVFSSPIGIGALWAKDNWIYTQTWESNWVPYYLMGARLAQDLPLGFRLEGWVVNGWQTIGDINEAPSFLFALGWTGDDVGIVQHAFFGPEQPSTNPEGWFFHSSTQIVWNTPRIGLAAVWDVGREQALEVPRPKVSVWTGGAAFLRVAALLHERVRLDVVARPEAWWDRDGRTFGNDGALISAAGGLALYGFGEVLGVHLEYRYDHSTDPRGFFFRDDAVTIDATGLAADQHSVILALVGAYEHRFRQR